MTSPILRRSLRGYRHEGCGGWWIEHLVLLLLCFKLVRWRKKMDTEFESSFSRYWSIFCTSIGLLCVQVLLYLLYKYATSYLNCQVCTKYQRQHNINQ